MRHISWMLASAVFVAVPVAAQTQDAAPAANQADPGTGLADVIVTAEKRSVNLQDTPLAISAYTSDARQLAGINTLGDFANFTPGLSYSASNDRVFIRGIGRQTNTNGSDPGVSTYTDGIYDAATNTISASDFFIQRVEVLRGPQGTLYGRNSIGGAINAISKRPTEDLNADLRGTLGNYDVYNLEASISGQLVKGLRARAAAGLYNQDQGYYKNLAGGISEGGRGKRRYYELQLEADLGPDAGAWVKVFSGNTDLHPRSNNRVGPYDFAPYPTGAITPGSAFGYLIPGAVTAYPVPQPPGATDIRNFSTTTTQRERMRDNFGVAGDIKWTLPAFDVHLLGGYQHYLIENSYALDDTGVVSYSFPLSPGAVCGFVPGCTPLTVYPASQLNLRNKKSFGSGELNLTSNTKGPFQWVAGVYYYQETLAQESHFNAPNQPQLRAPIALTGLPAPANPVGDFVYAASTLTTKSIAAFGQVDYQVSDTLRITGGLRYTHDTKSGAEAFRIVCLGCDPSVSPNLLGSLTPALDLTPVQISYAPAPGISSPVAIDPATGIARRGLSNSWDAVTGTAAIEWQPTRDELAFVRYSRGYKSGGFNAGGVSALPQTGAEHVDAFEAGYKRTLGAQLRINLAGFYYDYQGLQVPLTVTQPGGAQLTQFFNLASSQSYGAEAEMVWQPVRALQLSINYGYGHTRISRGCCFVDGQDPLALQPGAQPSGPIVAGQQPQSVAGAQLSDTPRHKVALNAMYSLDFDPGTFTLSGNYVWRGPAYSNIFNRYYNRMPSYDQVDLRAIWTGRNDSYRIIGFVKNLFDTVGYDSATGSLLASSNAVPKAVAQTYSFTPPRTYGVQLEFRFR
ncbi:TonB-dependent receptor [uncultured Sphingomonas sp.]|uniref:TonB-dependent receptor n=1 Tax=uncultured Sphingomonas sp. TaxID=158754 RepID=UPI00263563B3|nr:TonB-dependent receptor [uncultured Sphingomonas sp.]